MHPQVQHILEKAVSAVSIGFALLFALLLAIIWCIIIFMPLKKAYEAIWGDKGPPNWPKEEIYPPEAFEPKRKEQAEA
jgi:hypothetical protein